MGSAEGVEVEILRSSAADSSFCREHQNYDRQLRITVHEGKIMRHDALRICMPGDFKIYLRYSLISIGGNLAGTKGAIGMTCWLRDLRENSSSVFPWEGASKKEAGRRALVVGEYIWRPTQLKSPPELRFDSWPLTIQLTVGPPEEDWLMKDTAGCGPGYSAAEALEQVGQQQVV